MKLHLGCGNNYKKGFVNIDYFNINKVDLLLDIGSQPLPYTPNSVSYIESNHVFEHLNSKEFTFALKEIHRVLHKDGKCLLLMPYATSLSGDSEYHAFRPRYWTFKSFDRKFDTHEYESVTFNIERELIFRGYWKIFMFFNVIPRIYEETFLRYLIPAQEIKLTLTK